ncbi:phosphatase PAP2 family protein [Nonomuraea antri]|uniref:phosphatase PAP2 family protein n=1 Tax=Nonomuraea antri TaxID=2730852 RepID=UPI001C2B9DF3|nr:phosphatase PAP2 family protein [Nonomuraea antri]
MNRPPPENTEEGRTQDPAPPVRPPARHGLSALVRSTGGRPAVLAEAVGLLVVLVLFTRLHAVLGTDGAAATANALALQSLERVLHLDLALPANRWLTEHPALIQPAVYYYRLYYVAILGVLVWMFVRHAEVYVKVRRTLVAMLALVLPVYWAVPMSPPRFALPGVVDILARHDILGGARGRRRPVTTCTPRCPACTWAGRCGARTPSGARCGPPVRVWPGSRGASRWA